MPRPERLPDEVRIEDEGTGGQKGQKAARHDLVPSAALDELARVYGAGADKYSDTNYLRGYSYRLSLGALLRHVQAWNQGEDYDPETGLHHLSHAAWHCMTLQTFQWNDIGTDDRLQPLIDSGKLFDEDLKAEFEIYRKVVDSGQ